MTSDHSETFRSLIDLLERIPQENRWDFNLLFLLRNFPEAAYMDLKLRQLEFHKSYIVYQYLPPNDVLLGADYDLIFELPFWYNNHGKNDTKVLISRWNQFKDDFYYMKSLELPAPDPDSPW